MHATIRKVTDDVADRFNFNTAISSIMELVNAMHAYRDAAETVQPALLRETVEALLRLLAPFAPHIAEEIWQQLERSGSIHQQAWPKWDAEAIKTDSVEIVVQINGKVRDKLTVPSELSSAELEKVALQQEKVQQLVEGKTVVKVIAVPNKLVNIVVK